MKRIPQYILSTEDYQRLFLSEVKKIRNVLAKDEKRKKQEIETFKKSLRK